MQKGLERFFANINPYSPLQLQKFERKRNSALKRLKGFKCALLPVLRCATRFIKDFFY